jgi:hypothetical protein
MLASLFVENISLLTSRHGTDKRVDESDLGKHVEVNADRDQLYGKERVLQDEKKDGSGLNDEREHAEVPTRIYKAVLISKYIVPGPALGRSGADGAADSTLHTNISETKCRMQAVSWS